MPDRMSAFSDDFDRIENQYQPFGIILNTNTDIKKSPRLDLDDSLDEVCFSFKTSDDGGILDDFDNDIVIEALTNDEAEASEDEVGSG